MRGQFTVRLEAVLHWPFKVRIPGLLGPGPILRNIRPSLGRDLMTTHPPGPSHLYIGSLGIPSVPLISTSAQHPIAKDDDSRREIQSMEKGPYAK